MSNPTLPAGWEAVRLGDLFEFKYGKGLPAKKRDGMGFPVYGSNGVVGSHSKPLTEGPAIIVGRKGSIGEVHLESGACSPIDTTYYIDEFHNLVPRYWLYQLRSLPLDEMDRASAIPGLNRQDAYELAVSVPPLNEQRRIVEKIEALTAKSRRAKEALDAIPPLLERFRQSVLAAAFRGDLTADWRAKNPDVEPAEELLARIRKERHARWEEAELAKMRSKGKELTDDKWKAQYKDPDPVDVNGLPELPKGWYWARLDQLCSSVTDGDHQAPPRVDNGIPFLVIGDISDGTLDLEVSRFVPEAYFEKLDTCRRPQRGDVLYSVTGSFGIAVAVAEEGPFCVQRHIAIIRPEPSISPAYLVSALSRPLARQYADQEATGTAQKTVSLSALRAMPIPVAPERERLELEQRINQCLAVYGGLAKRVAGVATLSQGLNRAILAKAFRGELVPQDPNDEPASVLLERIRAEREKAEPKKRTKRRSKQAAT